MKLHSIVLLTTCVVTSGCGGSATSNQGDTTTVAFDELITRVETIREVYDGPIDLDDEPEFDFTPVANIPVSGAVTYTGYAALNYEDTRGEMLFAVGSATMEANFTDQTVRGGADNFYEYEETPGATLSDLTGEAIEGAMSFELAQVPGVNLYLGTLEGEVTFTDGEIAEIDLDGIGAFGGENAEFFGLDGYDQDFAEVGILMIAD